MPPGDPDQGSLGPLDPTNKLTKHPKEVHAVKAQRTGYPSTCQEKQKEQSLREDLQEGTISMHFYLKRPAGLL